MVTMPHTKRNSLTVEVICARVSANQKVNLSDHFIY